MYNNRIKSYIEDECLRSKLSVTKLLSPERYSFIIMNQPKITRSIITTTNVLHLSGGLRAGPHQ